MSALNVEAAAIRTDLHNLILRLGELHGRANAIREVDLRIDAQGQIEDAKSDLHRAYQALGDLFIDAHRDGKDQAFGPACEAAQ